MVGCQPPAAPPASGTTPPSATKRLNIACTVGMVTDIVRQVAGEHADVTGLLNEGTDPHVYVPTANDTALAMQADIVFYCGLHLEGRMVDDYEAAHKKGRKFFAVSDGIPHEKLRSSEAVAGIHDPHVWGDIQLWMECVREVAKKLKIHDPLHAADYTANADSYLEQLTKLDAYIREVIASIPEQQRTLVTAHDAFAYFSRAYGINVRAVQGISTESQAGVNDTNRLVAFLVENQIPTVFVEASVNPRDLEAVREGAKQQGWEVGVGGTLYSDSMGPKGTYEGTYIGMQDHNATLIARSLGGKAPERGWQGKLKTP
jgi:manganese/zinc/iron transport system substrate-binding protein